jgi:hypothetical protein
MTITISSDEQSTTDKILRFLRSEKVPFEIQTPHDVAPSRDEFLVNFRESLLWAKEHQAGKVSHEQSFDDFLNELERELESEKNYA